MKTPTKIIVNFVVLAIVGFCLIVFGEAATSPDVSTVLPLVGTGVFTAALTYFLVKVG